MFSVFKTPLYNLFCIVHFIIFLSQYFDSSDLSGYFSYIIVATLFIQYTMLATKFHLKKQQQNILTHQKPETLCIVATHYIMTDHKTITATRIYMHNPHFCWKLYDHHNASDSGNKRVGVLHHSLWSNMWFMCPTQRLMVKRVDYVSCITA